MAAGNFQKCLAFALKYEGGSSDDPRDPGGHTMEGITQKSYDCFLDKKGLPHKDVFDIPASERDEIYRTEYWNAVNGDALRPGEDLCVLVSYIADRMQEPSTWAGLSAILVAFKVLPNDPSTAATLTTVGVALGGVLATIFPEGTANK